MGENAEILIIFVEEDNDALFSLETGRDEDGHVWLCLRCTERQSDLLKTKIGEALRDDTAHGFC